MIRKAGIDFSITSPSVCILEDGELKELHFFRHSDKQKKLLLMSFPVPLVVHEYPQWNHQYERFELLTEAVVAIVQDCSEISIEGYAYGATGMVFDIAECTGLFKYKMWGRNNECKVLTPSAIKKQATGKGNAKKIDMYKAFVDTTGLDLAQIFGLTVKEKNVPSPLSDIADAYWVAKSS